MNTVVNHPPKVVTCILAATALFAAVLPAEAQVTVNVDPGSPWQGYMNVSELPSNGGAFVFGSPWGTQDLVAQFSGSILSLSPNTIGDPNPFWYVGGGGPGAQGNKIMDANFYVESTGPLTGTTVTFTGLVLNNTLTSAHNAFAFIKDFAPDYSSFNIVTAPLTAGVFNLSMNTDPTAGRHVQYGFEVVGPNVWVTDVGPYGSVQVTMVPEPGTLSLGILGAFLFLRRRHN